MKALQKCLCFTEIIAIEPDHLVAFINRDVIERLIYLCKVELTCHESYVQKGEMLTNSTKFRWRIIN